MAAKRLEAQLPRDQAQVVRAAAESSGLPAGSATVVYGEAMLSMQTADQKARIVSEAMRLLAPGGRYGIHELCLRRDEISEVKRREIASAMLREIHVGVQPLCPGEWATLLEQHGLKLVWTDEAAMDLLEPRRMLRDEGLSGCLRIALNVMRDPNLRRRMVAMRRISANTEMICVPSRWSAYVDRECVQNELTFCAGQPSLNLPDSCATSPYACFIVPDYLSSQAAYSCRRTKRSDGMQLVGAVSAWSKSELPGSTG